MTEFLEPKIESLVEALNSWEGIKTYSSCEGHNLHGSGPGPYVTFSCDDIKILGAISRKLIDLETIAEDQILKQVDFKVCQEIKPMDPKTNNIKPYAD